MCHFYKKAYLYLVLLAFSTGSTTGIAHPSLKVSVSTQVKQPGTKRMF